jgi:endo-1,3(4)-beta-glucanase
MTTPKGVQFLVQTQEDLTWILFASEPVAITYDSQRRTTISTTEPFTGVLRLALIPPSSSTKTLQGLSGSTGVKRLVYHAGTYPVGGSVSWDFHADTGTVHFEFPTMTMTKDEPVTPLLMLGLPHHADLVEQKYLLDSAAFDITYDCIKGPMTPVIGSVWSYDETLTSIGLESPNAAEMDPQLKQILMANVKKDIEIVLPVESENVYGYGKQLARLANLAHIATVTMQQSEGPTTPASHSQILADATEKLHHFASLILDNKVTDQLVYDSEFGGIVSKNGLANSNDDFGNGRYNDHHFHYGYILYACAVMGSLNSTFVSEYGAVVDNLLYDVAHSTGTSLFPLARHKSWFDSHSFASGLFPFSDGKSQESSSEAVNCYFGAYLWSKVRTNAAASRNAIDFARLLLATEIRGAQTYWHMMPQTTSVPTSSRGPIYVESFAQNYMVGNIGMLDAVSSTWFGREPLYVHMINFLPVTAITYELFDKTYVKDQYNEVIKPLHEVAPAWKGYTVCNQAIVEPMAAWKEALTLFSGELDSALSKSQVLYWISGVEGFTYVAMDDNETSSDDDFNTPSDSFCEKNDGCVSLGLSGLCCPTAAGIRLGCCSTKDETNKTYTNKINTKSCDANAGCSVTGLVGLCCPTSEGVMLGCCT